ncbi:hypothetical protein PC129_g13895 [Phytophthora cactorum]|uniref:Uncharacterized protein n=1 Tax=Phytophthora cactorum TaxID=29920 RepID=A0A8T0YV17_9STRA|nr:hypothetical protein PC111_g15207 [Phytophthora cactorum]KAG2837051.1 hypothetical protein PC112_g5072 [Phytophthora cactorum]KAG2852500.1 hypothetical protein PC113_g14973 [Phytophthora cactorum]KAG2922248.1 hypothetical protein PC114_g5350 [Phytophthora cactorum]KAG2924050.1 hypothetical protein PC117_g15527 [Phytophthora cactorum]
MWSYKLLPARRNFRESVSNAKLNKLGGGVQPCPLRSRNKPSGNVPVELNNRSVSAPIQKIAGQVKHRNNGKEYESVIVLGANVKLKRKGKRNGKRGKSAIAFFSCRTAPGCHRKNVKSGDGKIAIVTKKVEP